MIAMPDLPESSPAPRLIGWSRRRDLFGRALELSAQIVAPGRSEPTEPGRLRQAAALATSMLPRSIDSRRSIWSIRSMCSAASVSSLGSLGSVLSAGSAGSILSIGSAGSILSIGSVGSVLSIGSAGSVLSIGSIGRRRGRGIDDEAVATVRHLGTVAGSLAILGALASA